MAKIWQKKASGTNELSRKIEKFTVGNDREADLKLAKYDVLGSLAHCKMLYDIKLLTKTEYQAIKKTLQAIYHEITEGDFSISETCEDIHSEIEFRLTQQLGDVGKKIHSGRSRNDQVLLDLKLYSRDALMQIALETITLFNTLCELSEKHKNNLMPGYTHLQLAMPSSFGLWFGAYAESLVDDVQQLYSAFLLCNKNPLGSGAGYGGSFPLKRKTTTALLGFQELNYNSVYAQMNRGKMEKTILTAIAAIAATLSKLAMDCCLFMNQHFAFISFPDELTTGSSIMPHKKNPDVWELIRARCNKLQTLPNQVQTIINNLPSGYHRDFQILKTDYLAAFDEITECLDMTNFMLSHIQVSKNILNDKFYNYLFTVETVNELVLKGMSFRDAYIKVGLDVEQGKFKPKRKLNHTHEGSIGNLNTMEIKAMMKTTFAQFPLFEIEEKFNSLLS